MMTMQRSPLCIISGALLLSLAACGGSGSGNSDSDNARLSLAVTDAPVDNADAVVVTFTEVQLLSDDDDISERFVLPAPQQIDLLALQGDNNEFLVDGATVVPGVYDQVRLIVDTISPSCQNLNPPYPSYITIDGVDHPLVVPSGAQSGLKVQGPITAAAGGSASYTIDFDLRKAVAERGATGCYNLRPVLRVVDNAEVGTLTGTVDGDLLVQSQCTSDTTTGEGAAIYVFQGNDVVADDVDDVAAEPLTSAQLVALNDDSGDFSYEVGFLLTGDYTVAFTCQAGDDDPEVSDAIEFEGNRNLAITAGATANSDFELAAMTEEQQP